MPIESMCGGCGRRLRVADEHAGKRARCPHCGHIYDVPKPGDSAVAAKLMWQSPMTDRWEVRIADGRTYGPVPKSALDQWVSEGRVTADSELRRDGWAEWVKAGQMYPALEVAGRFQQPAHPFADSTPAQPTNPYASPAAQLVQTPVLYRQPHRGATILTLGILGIVCCPILGPVAWIMGHTDLAEMRRGRMDARGRGITRAGMIMGIVGTVFLVINILGLAFAK